MHLYTWKTSLQPEEYPNIILKVKKSRHENQQCSVSFLPLRQDIHSSFSGFPGV